jgi:hypothetical protein
MIVANSNTPDRTLFSDASSGEVGVYEEEELPDGEHNDVFDFEGDEAARIEEAEKDLEEALAGYGTPLANGTLFSTLPLSEARAGREDDDVHDYSYLVTL